MLVATKDPVDLGDPETGTASKGTDLYDHQDLDTPEATRTTKRTDFDDRQDPDALWHRQESVYETVLKVLSR